MNTPNRQSNFFSAVGLVLLLASGIPQSAVAATSYTVRQLYAFNCTVSGTRNQVTTCPIGGEPSRLIESVDGNFYGTTAVGGTGNQAAGTVFRLSPT